jgi:hypothetical protein
MTKSQVGLLLLALSLALPAHAYPWMIRHDYVGCASCHVDPSGSGLLTPYGLAQQDTLLTAQYGRDPSESRLSQAMSFLPSWLNAGFSFRGADLVVDAGHQLSNQLLLMIADVRAAVSWQHLHAMITVGFVPEGATLAALTPFATNNVVSRDHWVGYDVLDESILLRVGRVEMPFGLRNVEHPAWVRSETRTDTDQDQEYGVAAAYNGPLFRAELLGIAGNFLVRQPEYRDHGYSGYVEIAARSNLAIGISSMVVHADRDLLTLEADTWRQSHGAFVRWGIHPKVALLAEVDALAQSSAVNRIAWGYASFVQGDYEPVQGVHIFVTGESLHEFGQDSVGGWLSAAYLFFPGMELRFDSIFRRMGTPVGPADSVTLLVQLHLSI